MRIYLKTTPNDQIVSFDYQQKMVGTIHKWLGNNEVHNQISLYSFSWLNGGTMIANKGFNFSNGASFFISFYEDKYLKQLIKAILSDPNMFCGISVCDITIAENPVFNDQPQSFRLASPILIKWAEKGSHNYKFYLYDESESTALMTETLRHKMKDAGLPQDDTLEVEFDLNYAERRKKLVTIHGIKNMTNMCPIIIHGKPESKLFAWIVGIGNSTGCSFGALI
jgi:CRISPR-associated endoribonuclease Cas6